MASSFELLHRRIKAAIDSGGRTQAELGRLSKLGQGALGRLYRLEGNPTLYTLDAIARALGVPPWRLIEPAEENRRTALEDRIWGIIDRVPTDKLDELLRILEGVDRLLGIEEPSSSQRKPKPPRNVK
jgi:transcriptional regulator with XRE-family HTH domain